MLHQAKDRAWLLLVHQLPPRPTGLRVKVWRRLQDVGAVALKNSVYVLPNSDETREDFEWIKSEIHAQRGEAVVFDADSIDAFTNDEVIAAFRQARTAEYAALGRQAEALAAAQKPRARTRGVDNVDRRIAQLRDRLAALDAITYFPPENRDATVARIAGLAERVSGSRTGDAAGGRLAVKAFQSRVWVTRPRPGIDRLSSAWLIRRFIDPKARFTFADKPASDSHAIPFDMFGVEFGHTSHGCTFETLAARFGLSSPPLDRIAQIVHNLDLKDARDAAPEAPAIGLLVEGLRSMYAGDAELLEHGIIVFEALHRALSAPERSPRPGRRRSKKE